MEQRKKQPGDLRRMLLLLLLLLLLFGLMGATLRVIGKSAAVRSEVPFDLADITAGKTENTVDLSRLLRPVFLGLCTEESRLGTSNAAGTMDELYSKLQPLFGELFRDAYAVPGDEAFWLDCAAQERTLYLRYQEEMPDYVLAALASPETAAENSVHAMVRELFVLPYSEEDDTMTVAVRSRSGEVCIYRKTAPDILLTGETIGEWQDSYRSVLTPFTFAGTVWETASPTEPVFLEGVKTRDVVMTGGTASLAQNHETDRDALMRLFRLNPDKLLNRHVDANGTGSYIDARGILYIGENKFTYTAVQDGGVPVSALLPGQDGQDLLSCLRAAVKILSEIRLLNEHYAGGDAWLYLTSVQADDGTLTLHFSYRFDNLRIPGTEPAFTAIFREGRLLRADLVTLSVRDLGTRTTLPAEWWFLDYCRDRISFCPDRTELVYRNDYVSERVHAEWCAE